MTKLIEVEVDIDTDLLQQAMAIAKVQTPSEAINHAIAQFVRRYEERARRTSAATAGADENEG